MFWIILGIIICVCIVKRKKKEEVEFPSVPKVPTMTEREGEKNTNEPIQCYNADLEREIERLRSYWKWMSLAGGTDPILTPLIHFEQNTYSVTLTKRGYDLWTENLKKYYNGTIWEEREQALKNFETDLLGEYAGQLGISIEYIADHLIKLENERKYESDFTLTITTVVDRTVFENRDYFRQQVSQTPLF